MCACIIGLSACNLLDSSTQVKSVHRYTIDGLTDSVSADATRLIAENGGYSSLVRDSIVTIARYDASGNGVYEDAGAIIFNIGASQLRTGQTIQWLPSSDNVTFTFDVSGGITISNKSLGLVRTGTGLGTGASVTGSITILEYSGQQGTKQGRLRARYTINISNARGIDNNLRERANISSQISGSFELNVGNF
jgi:hypothetical protein